MRFQKKPLTSTFGLLLEPDGGSQLPVSEAAPELRALLRRHRALLLRGFDIDVDVILELLGGLLDGKMIYGGDRRRISACDTVQFTSPGREWIQLHCEASYSPLRPDFAAFYCDEPALRGGETNIGDGCRIYATLSRAAQDILRDKRIRYYNLFRAEVWRRAFRIESREQLVDALARLHARTGVNRVVASSLDSDDTLRLEHVTPAVLHHGGAERHAFADSFTKYADDEPDTWHLASGTRKTWSRFEDETPIPAELRREVDAALLACTVPVAWQRRDLLVFDNWSVLHGRNEFFDDVRSIFASFGYASWLRPAVASEPFIVA